MTIQYETVVPWGRSLDEYRRMFALTDKDLARRIVGCGDGPASFNAAMTQIGHTVVSCDPLYQWSAAQIQARIAVTYDTVIEQTRQNQVQFIWTSIRSPDELGQIRLGAMQQFLADFDRGKREGRYVAGELPGLPFATDAFELALCSHFLFMYSDNLTLAFHQRAIESMIRAAQEVRIFPLLTYNADPSPYVEPVMATLTRAGYQVSLETVPYEFQRGANQMLRIWRR